MIANLHFEKEGSRVPSEPELTPGLRRIDELMALVLARYEQAEASNPKRPVLRDSYPVFKEDVPCSC